MEYDLHSNISQGVALGAVAITTNTTTVGRIVDSSGFNSMEFLMHAGTITDGTYDFVLEQGDDPALADAVIVPAGEVLGSLTGFTAADSDTVRRVGTLGKLRYQRLSIVSTGVTAGTALMGALVIKGVPSSAPVAE